MLSFSSSTTHLMVVEPTSKPSLNMDLASFKHNNIIILSPYIKVNLKPKYGTSIKEHPDTHVVFKDFEIPYYKEAEKMAVELHKRLYRCHSVGWDIGITKDGPMFIEGNGLWEISLIQAAHGGLKKQIEKYFSV